jgi:hypothetical protein
VKGNAYRLVVAIDCFEGIVWIKWIATHLDYDPIDVTEDSQAVGLGHHARQKLLHMCRYDAARQVA